MSPADDTEDRKLPEGWASASVLELAELIRGVSYAKGEERRDPFAGGVPLLRANNIREELVPDDILYVPQSRVSDYQMLRGGDVMLAMSSGSKSVVGKAALVRKPIEAAFGAFCGVLRPCTNIDGVFFGYWFQTSGYRVAVSEKSAGVNINNLKRSDFEALEMPLPPLPEQRRIVESVDGLLERVNGAKERLARVPKIMKRFRQSVLAAACSGRLTADWREQHPDLEPASVLLDRIRAERKAALGKKYKEPEPVNPDELPELPEGWEWVAMGTCFAVCIGSTPSRAKPEYWRGDIAWISSGEVQFCRIARAAECITQLGLDNSSTKLNPPGTVLLGMIGEGRTRGQAAILDIPACNNQNCAAIRVSATDIPPEYVYYWLWSQYEATRQVGAGNEQPALNKSRVEQLPIPVPPLPEQREIVRRVEALFALADAIEKRVAAATARAEKITQSILAKAFRGELVPSEAELARAECRAYEPAAAMLERVRRTSAPVKRNRR